MKVTETGLHTTGLRDGSQEAPTAEDGVDGKGEKLWVMLPLPSWEGMRKSGWQELKAQRTTVEA